MAEKVLKRLNYFREVRIATLKWAENTPVREVQLEIPIVRGALAEIEATIHCIETGEPFLAGWYAIAPELYQAMDLHWYQFCTPSIYHKRKELLIKDLEEVDQLALPADLCTFHRLILRSVVAGDMPKPTAAISLQLPCDGISAVHHIIQHYWSDVPMYIPDPPYLEDERSINYYTQEIMNMVPFLEKNFGKKMDFDKLKEVVEESNKQYQLWMEFDELKRAVPCPVASFAGENIRSMVQGLPSTVGRPAGTDYMRGKVAYAEEKVRAKQGALKEEKIRVFWFDSIPTWFKLGSWLEKEWGANVINDYESDYTYELIDTSSTESIMRGLAKRSLIDMGSMVRQSRSKADTMLSDLTRVVTNQKIDCVICAGHMGHKDMAAAVGLMRERCRELGVAFLHVEMDCYDPRYTSEEAIKDKISKFFVTMGLG